MSFEVHSATSPSDTDGPSVLDQVCSGAPKRDQSLPQASVVLSQLSSTTTRCGLFQRLDRFFHRLDRHGMEASTLENRDGVSRFFDRKT